MNGQQPDKKSESFEVRLSHTAKASLMAKAKSEGRSASEVMRGFIAQYLGEQPQEARMMTPSLWSAGAVLATASLAGLVSSLTSSTANAPINSRPSLQINDKNH